MHLWKCWLFKWTCHCERKEKEMAMMPEAVSELVRGQLLKEPSSMWVRTYTVWFSNVPDWKSSLGAQSSSDPSWDWEVSDQKGKATTSGAFFFLVVFSVGHFLQLKILIIIPVCFNHFMWGDFTVGVTICQTVFNTKYRLSWSLHVKIKHI